MKKKREFDFLDGRKLQISLLKMKVTVLLLLVCVLQSMQGRIPRRRNMIFR